MLILTQSMEWRQEQLDDDDIGPILQAKEQVARPGWVDISDQSRELKILMGLMGFLTYQPKKFVSCMGI